MNDTNLSDNLLPRPPSPLSTKFQDYLKLDNKWVLPPFLTIVSCVKETLESVQIFSTLQITKRLQQSFSHFILIAYISFRSNFLSEYLSRNRLSSLTACKSETVSLVLDVQSTLCMARMWKRATWKLSCDSFAVAIVTNCEAMQL